MKFPATLSFLVLVSGLATAGVPVPDMDERTLQEKYHIAPTEEGLIGALQHQLPVVRDFAAMRLAESGDKAMIRPILAALAEENLEGSKIILATAAAKLGAAEGFDALKNMCDDRISSPVPRMSAAQSLLLSAPAAQVVLPPRADGKQYSIGIRLDGLALALAGMRHAEL